MTAAPSCYSCAHYRAGAVFELCQNPQSVYKVGEKEDFHTVGHMRERGACRPEGALYELRSEKR